MPYLNQEFEGEFYCSLDQKNRVNIPSGIRRKFLPEAENTLVITRGLEEENLYAYPLNEWMRLTKKFRKLNPLDKKVREFTRRFIGAAYRGTMDGQGRIIIPEKILKMGQIEKEMVLLGTLNKFEIWNPKVLDRHHGGDDKESLSDLAENESIKDVFFDNGE